MDEDGSPMNTSNMSEEKPPSPAPESPPSPAPENPPPLSNQADTPLTPPPNPGGGMSDNTWSMIAHLSGLIGYLGNGIGGVIATLVIWLIKKDDSPVIESQAREALNFNISVLIYGVALVILVVITFGIGVFLAIPAGIALAIFHVVCTIIAAIKANEGKPYRYPLTLRLVK